MLCFVLIKSVLLNLLCVSTSDGQKPKCRQKRMQSKYRFRVDFRNCTCPRPGGPTTRLNQIRSECTLVGWLNLFNAELSLKDEDQIPGSGVTIPHTVLSPPEWLHSDRQRLSHFTGHWHCEGQSHKTVSINHNVWRERRAEVDSVEPRAARLPGWWLTAKPNWLTKSAYLVECCFTSTETVGLLGTGAQDGHLDFHTAPELWRTWWWWWSVA